MRHHRAHWPLGGEYTVDLDSPHKGPVTRKMFLFDDVIMALVWEQLSLNCSRYLSVKLIWRLLKIKIIAKSPWGKWANMLYLLSAEDKVHAQVQEAPKVVLPEVDTHGPGERSLETFRKLKRLVRFCDIPSVISNDDISLHYNILLWLICFCTMMTKFGPIHLMYKVNAVFIYGRVDSRLAPSQRETSLQSKAISHWLGAHLDSALYGNEPGCQCCCWCSWISLC